MTRICSLLSVAFLAAYLTSEGCAHVVPVAADCGREVSASVLPAVETALVSADYLDELAKLVEKFSECVIRKGVAQITGEAKQDLQFAQTDQNARLKFVRGSAWLNDHPGS